MICEIGKGAGMMRIVTILTGENWTKINIRREGEEQADTSEGDSRNCCLREDILMERGARSRF
jgi:hypothetical protein